MQKIMSYIEPTGKEEYTNYLTFGSLSEDKGVPIDDISPIGDSITPEEIKPKRGRPRGSTNKKKLSDGSEIVLADETPHQQELPMYQSNTSYKETYEETNGLLRSSIGQIDQLQSELKGELDSIRASKTLKKKYDYISMLGSTAASLINTKVSVIKEMNKVITDSHNLDLKRMKELKVTENQVDDDKRIMDMYQAFVSTPVGSGPALGPNMTDITLMTGINNMVRADIGPDSYTTYTQNITPSQNMMRLEQNPDVKTVVVYDASTGRRWFDVMNIKTGESVPNVNKPDAMFLEDTTLDVRNGIARNTNLDLTYPLIVLNNSNMTEY